MVVSALKGLTGSPESRHPQGLSVKGEGTPSMEGKKLWCISHTPTPALQMQAPGASASEVRALLSWAGHRTSARILRGLSSLTPGTAPPPPEWVGAPSTQPGCRASLPSWSAEQVRVVRPPVPIHPTTPGTRRAAGGGGGQAAMEGLW